MVKDGIGFERERYAISYSGQSDDKHHCFLSEYTHSADAEGRWGFRVTCSSGSGMGGVD